MALETDAKQSQQNLMESSPASTVAGQNGFGQAQTLTANAQLGGQQQTQTVIGAFDSRQQAETAVNQLREQGFTTNEISVLAKGAKSETSETFDSDVGNTDTIADGVATGSTIGGVGGLMAAAGALAIPGIGPIVALGPLAAALSGAVAGGVAGGLVDYGIPDESGRKFESRLQQGKVLAVIRSEPTKVNQAAQILRQNGVKDVETH
jgi:uncharacterized membrane protein